jgi:hypothetical protein
MDDLDTYLRDAYNKAVAANKPPIFRYHSCWKCRDGELPCKRNYQNCEYPHARND